MFCLNEASGDNALQYKSPQLNEMAQKNLKQINANLLAHCYISLTKPVIMKFEKLADKVSSRSKISQHNFSVQQIQNIFTLFYKEAPSILRKKLPEVDTSDCEELQLSSALQLTVLDLLE